MEKYLYTNYTKFPVTFQRLDTNINDIAAAARGVAAVIEETLQTFETDERLDSRLSLIKAAVGYIYHLSEQLLPCVDDATDSYPTSDVGSGQIAVCGKKGGVK